MTQGEKLIQALRGRRWMTWGDLEALRVSTCPWRRLTEPAAQKALREGERIERKTGADGLLRLRVRKVSQ